MELPTDPEQYLYSLTRLHLRAKVKDDPHRYTYCGLGVRRGSGAYGPVTLLDATKQMVEEVPVCRRCIRVYQNKAIKRKRQRLKELGKRYR